MHKRKRSSPERASAARPKGILAFPPPTKTLAAAGLIALCAFVAHFPSLNGAFVLDDDLLVTDSRLIHTADGLYGFWCTTQTQDYWPLTNSSLWLEWRLWELTPAGYHLGNIILHVAESLLVWLILRRLSIPGAFLAALIFAVHPVNVESVAWIAQRKNTMAMLFFLFSIWCYLKPGMSTTSVGMAPGFPSPFGRGVGGDGLTPGTAHSPPPTARSSSFILYPSSFCCWYWLSLLAFLLAMLGKGSAAIAPLLLLLIVWWVRGLTRGDLLRIAPFFLVAAALAFVNLWFQTHGSGEDYRQADYLERLLAAGATVWFYLYKAVLPIDLAFIYPKWNIQAGNLLWWLPLLTLAALTAVLWWYRKSWSRPFLFAWVFFCVALVPVMGFVGIGYEVHSLVADRYQHIAIIALISLAAAGWSVWHRKGDGPIFAARKSGQSPSLLLAVAVVAVLMFLTWQQSGMYRDKITLYQAALAKNPESWLLHNNLGLALHDSGKYDDAIVHYRRALEIKPRYPEAHNNMGNSLLDTGHAQEAIEHYLEALKLKPNYIMALYNLGNAYKETGRYQQAIDQYQLVIKLNPEMAAAYNNLGVTLEQMGRAGESTEYFRKAVDLDRNYSQAHNNLGTALFREKRQEDAIEQFKEALRTNPKNLLACKNLALAYSMLGRSGEAIQAGKQALEIARSLGQAADVKELEDWLRAYQAKHAP
jgi:tetratricopeptide (TPR) repeat protein